MKGSIFTLSLTIAAMVLASHVAASPKHRQHSPGGEGHAQPLSLIAGGISPYVKSNCPQAKLAKTVVQVHITGDLLDHMGTQDFTCNKCVTQGKLSNKILNDDDGSIGDTISPPLPPADLTSTPFDIDLAGQWPTGADANSTLLIKFLLEDSAARLSFLVKKNAASDTTYTIVPGESNAGMFSCRGQIIPAGKTPDGIMRPFPYFVVRASWMNALSPNFGGLNIGISVPASGARIIPFYIDPIVHNNG